MTATAPMPPSQSRIYRILVVPLRYIGDTILTVPLLRGLRQQYPDACIHVLCSKTAAPLLEPCPYIDELLIEPKGTIKRLALLKKGHYDAILILRKSVTMALMARAAGIPVRLGYDKQRFPFGYKRWGLFLKGSVRYPGLRTQTPQAVSHLGFLPALTEVSQNVQNPLDNNKLSPNASLELWATLDDEAAVERLLAELGATPVTPLAIVHAASASHGKQIALEKFAPSIRLLREKGFRVLATGTASDIEGYERLREVETLDFDILAGRTTLRETYALYRRSQFILTVDSSPIHIAAAAQVPSIVGVFGPTNERQWGPFFDASQKAGGHFPVFVPVFLDLACRPCYAKVCEHNNCKELLTAGQIALAVEQTLAQQITLKGTGQ